MTTLGTPENPLTSLSADQALDHWIIGNGGTVYVDMASHMSNGGGRWFSMTDFATPIAQAAAGLPEDSVVVFETNRDKREEIGAKNASASHPLYWVDGPLSDNA